MLGNEGEILIRKSYLESVFEIEHQTTPLEREQLIKSDGNFVTEPVLKKLEENSNINKNNDNL